LRVGGRRSSESCLSSRLAPGCVTRFGIFVWRIKTGQFDSLLDFAEDPAFVELVFSAFVRHEVHQILGNDHRTVIVHHNNVAGKYRAAAAADRLLPADESQAVDGCRSRHACAPYRKAASQHAGPIAQYAIGNESSDITFLHPCAQNIAENAGARHAHSVGHGNDTFRHVLDRRTGRDWAGPALWRCEVFPYRHKAQCECRSNDPLTSADEWLRTTHPTAPDAFLQWHRGDCSGCHLAQNVEQLSAHIEPH